MNNIANVNQIFVPAPQIVFIDSQVEDYQMLANGVLPGIETVVLQGDRNGIEQISHYIKPETILHSSYSFSWFSWLYTSRQFPT